VTCSASILRIASMDVARRSPCSGDALAMCLCRTTLSLWLSTSNKANGGLKALNDLK